MIGLALGIIVTISVICVFCMILVGAASDPLSTFDSPNQREHQRSVQENSQGQRSNHHGEML